MENKPIEEKQNTPQKDEQKFHSGNKNKNNNYKKNNNKNHNKNQLKNQNQKPNEKGFKFDDVPLEKEDYEDEFVIEKIPDSVPIEEIIKIKQEITADTSEANTTQVTKKKENYDNKNKTNQQKNKNQEEKKEDKVYKKTKNRYQRDKSKKTKEQKDLEDVENDKSDDEYERPPEELTGTKEQQKSGKGFADELLKSMDIELSTIEKKVVHDLKDDKVYKELIVLDFYKIQIVKDDITNEQVGAITNAANERLQHGAGVAGAIVRNGGPLIQTESNFWVKKYGIVPTGCCTVTSGGDMNCKYVIHTVGPVYKEHSQKDNINLLASCVANTLEMAEYKEVEKVSLPAISSGIFGFPKELCANVMLTKAVQWCAFQNVVAQIQAERNQQSVLEIMNQTNKLKVIRFCNFDTPTVDVFVKVFDELFQ